MAGERVLELCDALLEAHRKRFSTSTTVVRSACPCVLIGLDFSQSCSYSVDHESSDIKSC